MRIFTVAFEQSHFYIDATSSYSLRMATCPVCNREVGGSGAGFNLPWANPESVTLPKKDLGKIAFWKKPGQGQLSMEQINAARNALRSMAPCPIPVPFGLSFGPIIGKVVEPVLGVTASHTQGISATATHLEEISNAGIALESYPTALKFYKKVPEEEIREIWAPPVARFAHQNRIEWCEFCESGKFREREYNGLHREELEIARSSIPPNIHVFRVWEVPSEICVTEHFIKTLSQLGLNKIDWIPVPVVD